MDIPKLVQNLDIITIGFIGFICISCIQMLDIKIIASISLFIFIIINYEKIKGFTGLKTNTDRHIDSSKDKGKGNSVNDIITHEDNYNTRISELLIQIQKFKRYNKISYKEGIKYIRKFFKVIYILEHNNIKNYNQYYDNAFIYLKNGINHLQSITVSLPERTLIDGIKHNDFEVTKKATILGNLCKELYNECYYILLNMSIKFNKEWSEKPNIYTKEIDMNSGRIEQYNETDEVNWSLY